ncbi:polysaccharide deacetylase family protein [Actinomadura kijaniata]|uniref:Peptidoglycan/xylan/chitin deacetylase (PgdA/CDA1 family) n=1 Tax=Actinomadura namibiensis TaxID=182080 RepID=A0A7W3LU63_ACTNM|nr:polysaccharide deacetylase family protein [Actinomadura namibiensis]MBA8954351.1 peptidoglycan/xylan/chitin deacetylase (PgdA/CDA1 family) [Actinomadura namibiensis]
MLPGGRGVRAAAGAVAFGLLVGACDGPKAADPPKRERGAGTVAGGKRDERALWARWGLKPLRPAPAPPAVRPLRLTRKDVRVFNHVPTGDRVVFITIDDGAEKDPKFVRMLEDLRVPVSIFLTDDAIRPHYAYFQPIQRLGNAVQNHTLNHPVMTGLGLDGQKRQICGAQRILKQRYGVSPTLFRPPFGLWNSLTKQAAASCGVHGIVLWRASMQINDMQYDDPARKLHPGDVLLAHFRGPKELKGRTMTHMFGRMLMRIRRQGFSVARLEDYVQTP